MIRWIMEIVKEQFRKFSTGSSYPAILDSDVEKTIIPLPSMKEQESIAEKVFRDTVKRNQVIDETNREWEKNLSNYLDEIKKMK